MNFNGFKLSSLITWGIASYFTSEFLTQLGSGISVWGGLLPALLLQLLFTAFERPIWVRMRLFRRKKTKDISSEISLFSIAALIFDTLINAAGIWLWVMSLPQTDLWQMLAATTYTKPTMSAQVAFVIAVCGGIFLAAAPEELWNIGEEAA